MSKILQIWKNFINNRHILVDLGLINSFKIEKVKVENDVLHINYKFQPVQPLDHINFEYKFDENPTIV